MKYRNNYNFNLFINCILIFISTSLFNLNDFNSNKQKKNMQGVTKMSCKKKFFQLMQNEVKKIDY